MSIEAKKRILENHSIPCYINQSGRLIADSMEGGTEIFEKVEDLTDCTKQELYFWLGY